VGFLTRPSGVPRALKIAGYDWVVMVMVRLLLLLLLLLHKMALFLLEHKAVVAVLPKVVSVALQLMPDVWLWVAPTTTTKPADASNVGKSSSSSSSSTMMMMVVPQVQSLHTPIESDLWNRWTKEAQRFSDATPPNPLQDDLVLVK
jgi:hypothetical protein